MPARFASQLLQTRHCTAVRRLFALLRPRSKAAAKLTFTFRGRIYDVAAQWAGWTISFSEEDESYGDLLDANEFQRADLTLTIFQAQINHFASALHERVEVFCLGVATSQTGDCGDVIALFVAFDDDGEFAGMLHRAILA
jgi:hypothetical protein